MVFKPGSFSDRQIDVMFNANQTINALVGSVRSGKTVSSLFSLVFLLPEYTGGNILLVGKTDRTLYRNIIKPLQDMFGLKEVTYSRGTGEGSIMGHSFFAAGANDEKAVTKIQGLTLALAYGDEVTTWPESFFNMLISRLSDTNAEFIGTMNPEGPHHWFKKNFLDREANISLKSWNFLIDENKNLPPEYVENLKKFYTGVWYTRYILGQWVLAEGAIYDMFSEEKHVKDISTDIWINIIIKHVSIDYGTSNPTAFLLWGNDGHQRYIKKEYYYDSKEEGRQKTDAEYADDLINFIGSEQIQSVIVDPSAASFKVELAKRGLGVVDADNDVLDGIRDVSTELSQGLIQIDPSCTNLIKEFSGYVWDIKAGERGEDKPVKASDHVLDALRYYVRTVPIYGYSVDDDYSEDIGYSFTDTTRGLFDSFE